MHSYTGVLLQFRMVNGYLYDVGTNSQQWLSVNNALFNKDKKNMFPSFICDNNTEDPTDAVLQKCLLKMPFLSPQTLDLWKIQH